MMGFSLVVCQDSRTLLSCLSCVFTFGKPNHIVLLKIPLC